MFSSYGNGTYGGGGAVPCRAKRQHRRRSGLGERTVSFETMEVTQPVRSTTTPAC